MTDERLAEIEQEFVRRYHPQEYAVHMAGELIAEVRRLRAEVGRLEGEIAERDRLGYVRMLDWEQA